jgi:chemotaxis protein methyltransferase CheR
VSESACRILAALLEAKTGQQLNLQRQWRFEAALAQLLRDRGFASLDELAGRVAVDPALATLTVDALLNNETYFFRDRNPFDLLREGPLKRLAAARAKEKTLRVWSAGCSTGQEAWSLAMLFADDALRWNGWTIEIVGTDVSAAAIAQAQAGLYSQFEVQRGLSVREMLRWFEEVGGARWRVIDALRSRVRFEVRNITDVAPRPGRFDILLCRNLLLYFSPERRRMAFDRLAEAMAPDGYLMLGAGETVIGQTHRFHPHPEHRGLYVPVMPESRALPLAARGA